MARSSRQPVAPELSAPRGNAGGSGTLREGSETLVNVRCGSYEWAILVRTNTVNSRLLYLSPKDVNSKVYVRLISQLHYPFIWAIGYS